MWPDEDQRKGGPREARQLDNSVGPPMLGFDEDNALVCTRMQKQDVNAQNGSTEARTRVRCYEEQLAARLQEEGTTGRTDSM